MSAPPTADMLTIMFEQSIKSEPIGFYACQPTVPAQMTQALPPTRTSDQQTQQTNETTQQAQTQQSQQSQATVSFYIK